MPDLFIFSEDEIKQLAATASRVQITARREALSELNRIAPSGPGIQSPHNEASQQIASAIVQAVVRLHCWEKTQEHRGETPRPPATPTHQGDAAMPTDLRYDIVHDVSEAAAGLARTSAVNFADMAVAAAAEGRHVLATSFAGKCEKAAKACLLLADIVLIEGEGTYRNDAESALRRAREAAGVT